MSFSFMTLFYKNKKWISGSFWLALNRNICFFTNKWSQHSMQKKIKNYVHQPHGKHLIERHTKYTFNITIDTLPFGTQFLLHNLSLFKAMMLNRNCIVRTAKREHCRWNIWSEWRKEWKFSSDETCGTWMLPDFVIQPK